MLLRGLAGASTLKVKVRKRQLESMRSRIFFFFLSDHLTIWRRKTLNPVIIGIILSLPAAALILEYIICQRLEKRK